MKVVPDQVRAGQPPTLAVRAHCGDDAKFTGAVETAATEPPAGEW